MIDGLTMDLFTALCGKAELEKNELDMVYGYLLTVLKLRWFTEREKRNILNLLRFVERLDKDGVLSEPIAAAKTLCSFETAVPWDEAVVRLPDNYAVSSGGETLTLEDLRLRGIEHIDFEVSKPIRSSTEFVKKLRVHSDGRTEYIDVYNVYTKPPTGEGHLYSAYGEKAVTAPERAEIF